MTVAVPTIAVFPEEKLTLDQKIEKWVWQYCRSLEQNYQSKYPSSSSDIQFKMEFGRKYIKVNHVDIDSNGKAWSGGVHAFIDKKTGEVYKADSWKSPAKHVRYDLRIIKEREFVLNPDNCGWAGGYLYMK